MKFNIFVLLLALFLAAAFGFKHRASSKSNVFIPSIVFPDVLPIGRGIFFRKYNLEKKNMTSAHKNVTILKNKTEILENSTNNTNESFLKLEKNQKTVENIVEKINDNFSQNNISVTNETKKQDFQNSNHFNFKQPFHILGCLTFIQKDALTSQLLVCLSIFALVLLVIFCVQCGLQSKEKKEKEFQRVFKMAVNNDNC